MRWRRGRAFNNSWGGSTDWLRLTAHSNIIDDLIERQEEEVYRSEEEREEEKWTCTHSSQWPSWGHWCKRTGFLGFYAHVFPLSFSLFHTRSTRTTSHFQFRGHLCFLSLLFYSSSSLLTLHEWFSLHTQLLVHRPEHPRIRLRPVTHDLTSAQLLCSNSNGSSRIFTAASDELGANSSRRGKTWFFVQQQQQQRQP